MREVDTKEDRHHQEIGPGAITLAQESGSMKLGSVFPAGNGVFAYDCFDSTRACTYDQLRTLLNDDLGGADASTRGRVVGILLAGEIADAAAITTAMRCICFCYGQPMG